MNHEWPPIAHEVHKTGQEPKSLFVTGIHGDERFGPSALPQELEKLSDRIGSFILVARANSLALDANTRTFEGVDGNRMFENPSVEPDYPWAKQMSEFLHMYPDLEYVFSFHEHLSYPNDPPVGFYFYIIPKKGEWTEKDVRVRALGDELLGTLVAEGFPLHTGPDAPDLGNRVFEGRVLVGDALRYDKSFESYAREHGVNVFVFEINGEDKQKIMDLVFEKFIVPLVHQD